jgi:MFS family permease
MKDRLFRLISNRAAEESGLTYLLVQSLFVGIFIGTFDVIAHSLFLSVFDEKIMARAYVISGLAGIILILLYSRYLINNRLRNLAGVTFIFSTVVTFLSWILLLINPVGSVFFMVFVLLGPLNFLVLLGIRAVMNDSDTVRNGNNTIPILEGGLISGIILSCYAIPILLFLNITPINILLISAIAVLTVTIMQIIKRSHILNQSEENLETTSTDIKVNPFSGSLREDTLLRSLVIFCVFPVMTALFIQYSFMAVTRIQYPASEDMAHFLGLFIGSVMVFTLMIKFFVFPYFMRTFGLRSALIITPILIALITAFTIITGFTGGYTPATAGFLLFFILLALNRLFSGSLKESVEFPSVKIISQVFEKKMHQTAKTVMATVVNEIAVILSGLILAGLGLLSFIKLIHFPVVLIVIALLWILAGLKLYERYKNSALKTGAIQDRETPDKNFKRLSGNLKNRFSAGITFGEDYFNLITGDFRYLESNDNKYYFKEILDQADIKQDINLLPALKKIKTGTGVEMETRQRSAEIITNLENLLSAPREKLDRQTKAIFLLTESRRPQTSDLLKLMRDRKSDMRMIALYIIRKFHMTLLLPEVCECIGNPALEPRAADALRAFGKEADEALRRYYFRASGNFEISKAILRLLGSTCNPDNEEFLFSLLWSGPRQSREAAVKSLAKCNYKTREEEKERLLGMISDVTGILTWNLSARITIKRKGDPLLLEAINKDIERWGSFLFDLLSITYDAACMKNIRENINSGTHESVRHALEMIDIVADETVKPKLRTLFDVISDRRKVNILHRFFPGEVSDYENLAEDIINRDYNFLGVWIRACVIRRMPEIKNRDLAQSIVALLFSPETILREETAKLLARSDKGFYEEASDRVPLQVKESLEKIFNGTIPEKELLYEKINFLESIFDGLPEENLFFLAGEMKYAGGIIPELLPVYRNCILWQGTPGSPDFHANVFYENVLDSITGHDSSAICYVLPLQAVEKYHYKFPEHSLEILKYIDEIE